MSQTAGIFTLRAHLIPLGNLFGHHESHAKEGLASFVSFDLKKVVLFAGKTYSRFEKRKTIA